MEKLIMPKLKSIEDTKKFTPKFVKNGLIPVIAQHSRTGQILMFAYMNKTALNLTIKTGFAVYYSRSRKKLWKKGEKSGHFQKVKQILVDCDQDCLILKVSVKSGQCHAGYQSCFSILSINRHRKTSNFSLKKHRDLLGQVCNVYL